MYAIKGSWVGQTFALATGSESSGKKSRIRRSKEERKSMIETFIKTHQSSNNGSFPSLNLTHKEVGGSFYTVREIVREIIQENRVLGPAQYPRGSIASEPDASVFHTRIEQNDVFDDVSNQLEEKIMELSLDNEEHYINDQDMNSYQSASEDEVGENFDDQALSLIGDRKAPIILPTEEIVVETFPLKQEHNDNGDFGGMSIDSGNSNGIWSDVEVKSVDLTNGRPHMDKISSSVNSNNQVTEKVSNGSQMSNHVHVNGELAEHTDCNQINETSEFTESPEIKEDTVVPHDHTEQLPLPTAIISKTVERHDQQSNNAPKGTTSLDGRSSKSNKESPFLAVSGNSNRRDCKAVAASSPPVDRINLQSWEKAVLKQQPNPLLAILKAFADALIKFWS